LNRVFIPTAGIGDWRRRLADPEKQWQREASAFETAVSWECAAGTPRGIPASIAAVLDQDADLRDSSLLLALPEHKVPLPGGSRASQTDVWALLRCPTGMVSMAVEGKAEESFGETLETWQKDASPGKAQRLAHLCEVLQVTSAFPANIRYQLLHRTASALLEARRFGAAHAVMLVQAFRPTGDSFSDYQAFGQCLGISVGTGMLSRVPHHANPRLHLGWAVSPLCSDPEIVRAAV
jgi:hypothetical protein